MVSTTSDPASIPEGYERQRLKSYKSIVGDYQRIFGEVPLSLSSGEGAFGGVAETWYENPRLGAVTLNILLNAAVESCGAIASTEAVTPATAEAHCLDWGRKFWIRLPMQMSLLAVQQQRWNPQFLLVITSSAGLIPALLCWFLCQL